MRKLNFPDFKLSIKSKENKKFIFDSIRKKWVLLTPEEWVRQNIISYLVKIKKYPKSHLQIERSLKVNSRLKRYDILTLDKNFNVLLLVECKSPTTRISRSAFDQVAQYNLEISSKYIMVSNGIKHYFCEMDYKKKIYLLIPELPNYNSRKK